MLNCTKTEIVIIIRAGWGRGRGFGPEPSGLWPNDRFSNISFYFQQNAAHDLRTQILTNDDRRHVDGREDESSGSLINFTQLALIIMI